jgi:hypothetical protein
MVDRTSWLGRLGLALLWWLAAAALVGLAAALAAGAGLASLALSESEIGEVQRAVWLGLAGTLATQALAPLGLLTVLAWLGLAARFPRLDARWRGLLAGIPLVAALGFLPVGAWLFTAWRPETSWERAGTLGLVAGGVAAALLLARRALPVLAPGTFSGRSRGAA